MTDYYFIIYPADYPQDNKFDRSLVRLHDLSTPKAAENLRQRIEREVNGGHLWTIEDTVNNTSRHKVVKMSHSHAREYTDFGKWPCNK